MEGLTELQTKEKEATRQDWYWIHDGRNFHASLLKLSSPHEPWTAFQGPVTFLAGGHLLNVLKHMIGGQRARHPKWNFVRRTLLGALNGQEEDFSLLQNKRGEPETAVQVACESDGVWHRPESTMKQSATTVDELDCRVFHKTGSIVREEIPYMALEL